MNFYIIRKAVGKVGDYAPFVVDLYEKRSGRIERVANALRQLENVAFKKGTNVWLEFDPAVDPILSLQLVYRLHSVVNVWKVGSFEFKPQNKSQSDWKKFREEGKAKGFFKTLGSLSALTQYDVKYIDGDTRLLLVAPHGITTKPGDDINTGKLAIKIAERLECRAIINDVISRLYLDLNKVDEAKKHKKFISAIENSVANPGRTLVVWVHGIDTLNLKNEIRALGVKKNIHCLIGYGQPGKLTANQKTVDDVIDSFEANSILAHAAPDGSNYCGHSSLLMNQWFRSNGYKLKDVESIQLEFKYERIRRSEDLDGAAKNIAGALSALVKS